MNYNDYIEAYQFYKGCTIPELNAIVEFTRYWEQEGIPPHMWREWIKQHKTTFEETGSVHDVMKELKQYAEVSRKKYLEQVPQSEPSTWNKLVNFVKSVRSLWNIAC